MHLKETVLSILNRLLEDSEAYLVEINVSKSKIRTKITVFLDTDLGISIVECGEISKKLGEELDEILDEAYTLEVSSPGADAPILLERQYIKNIGRKLEISTIEDEKIVGVLEKVENEELTIQPNIIKKMVPEKMKIKIKNIKQAKVVISFK